MIISLTGIPGSGKSTAGKELASLLGWPFIDLDEYVAARSGRSIPEMFAEGEAVFRAAEEAALLEILDSASGNLVLALGGGTICNDGPAQAVLAKTTCFWLRVDPATALARIPDISTRPLLSGNASADSRKALETLQNLLTVREKYYRKAHFHIPCDYLDPDEVAASVITLLGL